MAGRVDSERLRDLESVTDAALAYLPFEELLDELLSRVVGILDVDTASILLLEDDARTLVPRAVKGLEGDVEGRVRIAVGEGFAGRIAATREAAQVADLSQVEIVNPTLREKGVKSLLGVPLIVEGTVLGVLHVGSLRERVFTDDDVGLLQRAGDRAALAISGRMTDRDRDLVAALQRSLIPRLPEVPGMSLEGRYLPAASARLGGDWYDAFPLPGGRLGMAIGDVSGRGFHAAALMGQLRSALRAYGMDRVPPGDVVERLSALLRQLEPGRNATLLYLLLDPQEGSLQIAGAGHPPPLVIEGDGTCSYLELPGSVPLGAVRYASYEEVDARLEPGSTIVLYTDGWVERPGEPLDVGLERLRSVVCDAGHDPDELCRVITEALLPSGATRDDAALLVARALPLGDPLVLRLPADVDSIPPVRRVLGRWLREAGATRSEIDEISLACSEACANAIEHAYAPGPAALEVSATLSPRGEAMVSVRDFGSWRPPRGDHRGRGMVLMKGLMDSVDVDRLNGGTEVRLGRGLEQPSR
ncbi:MAG TPA: SpoIIE family protein phosphatase [Thermoleophilaceae bacterium]|nr:SpoIIE family protein phosphatase [Thermoleophilaceae bacterium]